MYLILNEFLLPHFFGFLNWKCDKCGNKVSDY